MSFMFQEGLVSQILSRRRIRDDVLPSHFDSLEYFKGKGSNYPPHYLNPHSEYKKKFCDMANWVAQHLNNQDLLIDIGGGPGHLGYWMEKLNHGIKVIHTDYSLEALTYSQQQYPHEPIKLTADKLPFKNNCCDGVLFADIIEHLSPTQTEHALSEAKRILKLNSQIFINIPNRTTWTKNAWNEPSHIWIPTIKDMKQVLTIVGFKNIKTSTRGFPFSSKVRQIVGKDLHFPILGTSIFIIAQTDNCK